MKKILIAFASAIIILPTMVLAAPFDDLLFQTQFPIQLVNGVRFTIDPATRIESATLGDTGIDFTVNNGSLIILSSPDKSTFTVANSLCGAPAITCGFTQSTLEIHCIEGVLNNTLKVTPGPANSCAAPGTSSGSGGGVQSGSQSQSVNGPVNQPVNVTAPTSSAPLSTSTVREQQPALPAVENNATGNTVGKPGAIKPRVSVTPSCGVVNTIFQENGTGFTPNGSVTLYFRGPNGKQLWPVQEIADDTGFYMHNYQRPAKARVGTYTYWAVDNTTKKITSKVNFLFPKNGQCPKAKVKQVKSVGKVKVNPVKPAKKSIKTPKK